MKSSTAVFKKASMYPIVNTPHPQVRYPTKIGKLTKAQREYFFPPAHVEPVLISTIDIRPTVPTASTWKQALIQNVATQALVTAVKEVLRYFLG